MRAYVIVPALVMLASTPALAQIQNPYTPYPNRSIPGSGTEKRDDNVWYGAAQSSRGAYYGYEEDPYVYGGRSAVEGPPPYGPYAAEPPLEAEELPPNRALPGSEAEQRDENVWFAD